MLAPVVTRVRCDECDEFHVSRARKRSLIHPILRYVTHMDGNSTRERYLLARVIWMHGWDQAHIRMSIQGSKGHEIMRR